MAIGEHDVEEESETEGRPEITERCNKAPDLEGECVIALARRLHCRNSRNRPDTPV